MGDELNPVDEASAYRWRPAVSPYRPPGIPRIRSRKSLPGQMVLPGMPCGEESAAASETVDREAPPTDTVPVEPDGHADLPRAGPACPNCGSTEFDDDGDCTQCWEPGVAPIDTQPKAKEG